jgi:DNA recombination protein RmuC
MELTLLIIVILIAIAYAVYAEMRIKSNKADGARIMKEVKAEAEHRLAEQKAEGLRRIEELKSDRDKAQEEYKTDRASWQSKSEGLVEENTQLRAALESTQSLLKAANEQAKKDEEERQERFQTELKLAREQMRAQFEREMADRSDILKREASERMERLKQEAEERMESMRQTNTQQMSQIVDPLKKQLEELHRLVDDNKLEQSKNTSALAASIKAVFEHDKERDKTTQSLAAALKNRGKVQGDWGEQVLENILRDSGLRRGEEYFVQENVKTDSGANIRPDIIVKSANGSRIVIDSKVSLTAYTDYVGAETDEERQAAIKANYDSIWQHVVELSDMKYDKEVERAIPMVLMFVPNEGSYILAMNRDPQLGSKAYQKGVLIINPTNLMVVLRLMFLTWQNTRQEKNNREILKAASDMYDKYCTFVEEYVKLGNQLNTARTTYDKGLGQLREGRGNLSKRLENLRQYGVTPAKQIPEKMQSLTDEDEIRNEGNEKVEMINIVP